MQDNCVNISSIGVNNVESKGEMRREGVKVSNYCQVNDVKPSVGR